MDTNEQVVQEVIFKAVVKRNSIGKGVGIDMTYVRNFFQ